MILFNMKNQGDWLIVGDELTLQGHPLIDFLDSLIYGLF